MKRCFVIVWLALMPGVLHAAYTLTQVAFRSSSSFLTVPRPPVVGNGGVLYWQDSLAGTNEGTRLVAYPGGELATDSRTLTVQGDFPVGNPLDASGGKELVSGYFFNDNGSGFDQLTSYYEYPGGSRLVYPFSTFPSGITSSTADQLQGALYDSDGSVVFGMRRVSGLNVEFTGIYRQSSGAITTLLQSGITLFPGGGTNTFSFIGALPQFSVNGGIIFFYGEGNGKRGVYEYNGSTVTKVLENGDPYPAGTGTISLLGYTGVQVANEGNNLAVAIYSTTAVIFKRINGHWSLVAKQNDSIPGGKGVFYGLSGPSIHGTNVMFYGERNNQFAPPVQLGIFVETAAGIKPVVVTGTNFDGQIISGLNVAPGGRYWDGQNVGFQVQNYYFTNLIANYLAVTGSSTVTDTNRPTLSFSSPTTGQHWSNAMFTVRGKAADNVAVSDVLVSVNGAGWIPAIGSNNWNSWSLAAPLTPGTNTISAYAVDTSGNDSTTNTVKLVYVLSGTLTVLTNGDGTFSPNYNNAQLQLGLNYSVTAKAAPGFGFVSWTDGQSNVLSKVPTLKFVMASNLTVVANFRDVTRPTLIITSPTASLHPTNALLTITGKARDNVAISNIMVAANGVWSTATSTNGGNNWFAPVTLVPGVNTISAYAMDTSGNISLTNKLKLIYILMDRPTVRIVGQGSVTPNYNGKSLVISNRYAMKATAAKGSAFATWDVGGITSTVPTLTFTMASNLTLTATFKDVQRPVNAILFPLLNQKWSNAVISVTGKAGDNVGVSNVWCQINNGGWAEAASTNHFVNWSATNLIVAAGTNLVQAYAVDAAGNVSMTNAVKFHGFPP